jgi:pyruvate ferredoxin oxidoreductase alpha subunit
VSSLLSVAAFDEGRHAEAFPSFGSERTGAPVVSFWRIGERPIRAREPIGEPDALIIVDPTLLHQVDVFGGLKAEGYVLINSSRSFAELRLEELLQRYIPERLKTVPATELARALGRPLPNAALLGGFAALTGVVSIESVAAAIGASAAGARAYTATASQGLLYMTEALYNASGLGLPIVMTVANRALGAPINIWNDHSDSMSQHDSGWIQLYVESNQEALDVHIQAFKLAEQLSLPVMVCMDGFILTHAYERLELAAQEQVDAFLPPFEPRQLLDPAEPVTIGAMVGPEAFTEVKYLAHYKQMQALDLIPEIAVAFEQHFGRASGGLLRRYRSHDADTIVVALGSVLGTIEGVVDQLREGGVRIGCVGIKAFRPWPRGGARRARERDARDRA